MIRSLREAVPSAVAEKIKRLWIINPYTELVFGCVVDERFQFVTDPFVLTRTAVFAVDRPFVAYSVRYGGPNITLEPLWCTELQNPHHSSALLGADAFFYGTPVGEYGPWHAYFDFPQDSSAARWP